MQKENYILMAVKGYDIPEKPAQNGQPAQKANSGITCMFFPADNFEPIQNIMSEQIDRGRMPLKFKLPLHNAHLIGPVPGMYECTTRMMTNTKGVGSMTITDFKYIGEIKISVEPDAVSERTTKLASDSAASAK